MTDAGNSARPARWWKSVAAGEPTPTDLDTSVPHPARTYDYLLGGKDNFSADREAAEQALAAFPHSRTWARQNRAFMRRVTCFLAEQAGIRQFLDIGTGIPTSPNLHEVAQGITAQARVVYVDNDPIVLAHARALLASNSEGRTAYIDADLRHPESILEAPALRDTFDLRQPVALSLIAVVHFFPDDTDPYGIIGRLLAALPSGSYLALTHATADFTPEVEAVAASYRKRGIPLLTRRRAEVERFFDGLERLDPGVQLIHRWRPDDASLGGYTDAEISNYGGLARKA